MRKSWLKLLLFVWVSSLKANRIQLNITYKSVCIFLVSYLIKKIRSDHKGYDLLVLTGYEKNPEQNDEKKSLDRVQTCYDKNAGIIMTPKSLVIFLTKLIKNCSLLIF